VCIEMRWLLGDSDGKSGRAAPHKHTEKEIAAQLLAPRGLDRQPYVPTLRLCWEGVGNGGIVGFLLNTRIHEYMGFARLTERSGY